MTDWLLVTGIAIVFWVIIWQEQIWNMLFRNNDKATLKERVVPEGRAIYFIGRTIVGQVSKILGPVDKRPNPKTQDDDFYFGYVINTSEGDESVEWLWSNELKPIGLENYAGRQGSTWKRVNPDPSEELLRDKEAQIFALKHELKEMYEITENRNKIIFDSVHEVVQKFLPKVAYQPGKKKSSDAGMPSGGGEDGG